MRVGRHYFFCTIWTEWMRTRNSVAGSVRGRRQWENSGSLTKNLPAAGYVRWVSCHGDWLRVWLTSLSGMENRVSNILEFSCFLEYPRAVRCCCIKRSFSQQESENMSAFLFFSSCLLFFIQHFDCTERFTQLREYKGDAFMDNLTFRDTAPDT